MNRIKTESSYVKSFINKVKLFFQKLFTTTPYVNNDRWIPYTIDFNLLNGSLYDHLDYTCLKLKNDSDNERILSILILILVDAPIVKRDFFLNNLLERSEKKQEFLKRLRFSFTLFLEGIPYTKTELGLIKHVPKLDLGFFDIRKTFDVKYCIEEAIKWIDFKEEDLKRFENKNLRVISKDFYFNITESKSIKGKCWDQKDGLMLLVLIYESQIIRNDSITRQDDFIMGFADAFGLPIKKTDISSNLAKARAGDGFYNLLDEFNRIREAEVARRKK